MNRRTLLIWLVRGMGLATAAVVGIPAAIYALAPGMKRRPRDLWRPVGRLEEFEVKGVRKMEVEVFTDESGPSSPGISADALSVRGVYVWRPSEDEIVVFSRNCTDLSCPLTWDAGSEWFYCPCHGGIFSKAGEQMAGPPKRPMFRYANRVRNGVVEIDLSSVPPMA